MSVEHHRESVGRRTDLGEPVLNVVVILRPAIDVRAVTTRPTEAALVIAVDCDPCARELRYDARVAARMFRDAVNEEKVRARSTQSGPSIRA